MANLIIREHNIETGEILDREMTETELKAYQIGVDNAVKLEALAAHQDALKEQKLTVLEKLGLTVDEVAALLA
jgi:hypothetical protein